MSGPTRGRLEPPALFLQGMKGERERRGFLVTHVVRRDGDGVPIMKLSDSAKVQACMEERRCQACGFAIDADDWICFVGGPGDIDFAEAPLHLICADYSLGTCPHLLRQTKSGDVQLTLCREYDYIGVKLTSLTKEWEPHCRPRAISEEDAIEVARTRPYADLAGRLPRLTPEDLRDWIA